MVADLQTVSTFDELRGIALGTPPAPSFKTVNVDNRNSSTTGGGGLFRWDPSSVLADNDGTIIEPNGIGSNPGRWSRVIENGNYDFRWFGAKGDGRTVASTMSITAGTKVLTSATPVFRSADANKLIWVPGAGPGGGLLSATVETFTSSTQITLSIPAATSLATVPTTVTVGSDATLVTRNITVTAGNKGLTSATPVFSLTDVNKLIRVPGAGNAGGVLNGIVESFTSPTQITLNVPAVTSLNAVSTTITLGSDDTPACQATIDAAMAAGVGVEFSCGDYVVGPLYGNGSAWVTLGPPANIKAQQPAVLSFRGQGRAPDLCRLIAMPGAYAPGQAVLTFRNVFGVVVSGFEIDANDEAEIAGDFAWSGTADGNDDSAAPSCNNEFTHLYALKARRMGFKLDQAADCKVSSIWYRGGTASVGVSMRLPGGGIWADNIFCTTGKFLVACQNAGFQNCGFFGGIQITDAASNLLHFDACHVYPYTPKRTVAFGRPLTNPFSTIKDQTKVTVTMFNHGLTTGNFIEVYGADEVGGLDLDTTPTTPYAVTPIDNDHFSIEASTPASSTATGGGSQVDVTGRGYSLFSNVPKLGGNPPESVLGAQSVIMTACWFNSMGVTGQKYFAGRWMNGARFFGCRFGVNSAVPAAADIYFDTDNWSTAGGGGTMPLFFFDNCTFAAPRPASITYVPPPPPPAPQTPLSENTVLCGFNGYQDETGTVFSGIETPGDIRMPRSAFDRNRLQMGASSMWEDTGGLPRWKPNDLTPNADSDGGVMLLQQTGTTSPLGSVTPLHRGAQYYDLTNNTIWLAYGSGNSDWSPIGDKGANIASAATVDLSLATGDYIEITGTATISAFGTVRPGVRKLLRFQGGLTLTYNATSLIIPGATNLVVSAGSVVEVLSLGGGNWVVTGFSSAGFNAGYLNTGTVADARLPSTMVNKTLTTALVTPTATTIALLPAASSNANQLRVVTDGAPNKRLVISDGAFWRYVDGETV